MDRVIRSMFPAVEVDMLYRMPTYHVGENVIAWGSQKSHFAVYTCSAVRLDSYRKQHPQVKCGVGCIRIRDVDAFPIKDIRLLVRDALAPSKSILARERAMVEVARKARARR